MTIARCAFMRIADETKADRFRFQNFFINKSKSWSGRSYNFVPFGITPGSAVSGGDRSEQELVFPLDDVSTSIVAEAVQKNWYFYVDDVIVDRVTMEPVALFVSGRWRALTFSMNPTSISVTLAPPFDAIQADFPKRRLTRSLVGILPISGVVQF